jgi:hypothetical protein
LNLQINNRLQIIGSAHQAVRMVCTNSVAISENVCAYVSGIRIGVNRIEGDFEPGDIIEYPISYLPWVDLPTDVRFVSEHTGQEIAEAFRIATHDEAIALVGMGESLIQNVVIDQGMIRGVVVNRVNGLLRPQMFARINGIVPRMITVEQPRLLDDGGASFQFSAQLNPADLGENGLTAEIFLLGQDAPLTSVSYRRADIDDLTKRIVEFEARLAQVTQSTGLRFNTMNHEVQQSLKVMQQRIDAFIEYAASFMFDRVATSQVPMLPDASPLPPNLRKKVDSFLAAVRDADAAQGQRAKRAEPTVTVPIASSLFSFGWHDIEKENDVSFRRMADIAVVMNPFPDRRVESVQMTVFNREGVESLQPSIRAAFDGMPVVCTVERGTRKSNATRIRVVAGEDGSPAECRALNLVNMLTNVTSGRNQRSGQGSLAISALTFTYAG